MKRSGLSTKVISLILAGLLALLSAILVVTSGLALRRFKVEFLSGDENAELYRGENVQYVHSYTELVEPVFVNKGYNFIGWDIESLSMITDHATVTAKWAKYDFNVKFEGHGGVTKDGETELQLTFDSGINIVPPEFIKEGYTIKWNADFITIKEDCTLWAEWIPNEYTITYNDGQTKLGQEKITYATNLLLPQTPKKSERKFLNWLDEHGNPVDNGMHYEVAKDIVLTAEWVDKDVNVITYNLNGGKQLKGSDRTYGSGAVKILDPVKDGYKFEGWQISDGQTVKQGDEITTSDFSGDVTLNATWSADKIEITFSANGGQILGNDGLNTMKVSYGDILKDFPVAQKEGFVFDGWRLGGYVIKDGIEWVWAKDVTLVATYKKIYTITFDLTAKVRGFDVECRMIDSGSIVLEENQTIEQITITVLEGESLLKSGVGLLPNADPIEPRGVDEYSYAGFWRYYYDGKNYKVYPDTIFNESNFPGSFETGKIVIRPSCRAHWTPPY